MKKKFFAVIAASLLIIGIAGQAMAYFEDFELIRVVSQVSGSGNNEVITDLGHFDATSLYAGGSITFNTSNFSTSQFGGTAITNLAVQYYIANTSTFDQVWISGPTTGQKVEGNYYGLSALGGMYMVNLVASQSGTAQVVWSQDGTNSVKNQLENGGLNRGAMTQWITEGLASAALTGSAVEQYLYYYSGDFSTSASGIAIAKIVTNADGSTTISAISAVPIPAAIWFLGSGLIGLVGVRRRMTVA
jgi:hypothetical protein